MTDLRGEHFTTRAPLTQPTVCSEGFAAANKARVAESFLKQSFLREAGALVTSKSHQIFLSKGKPPLELKKDWLLGYQTHFTCLKLSLCTFYPLEWKEKASSLNHPISSDQELYGILYILDSLAPVLLLGTWGEVVADHHGRPTCPSLHSAAHKNQPRETIIKWNSFRIQRKYLISWASCTTVRKTTKSWIFSLPNAAWRKLYDFRYLAIFLVYKVS